MKSYIPKTLKTIGVIGAAVGLLLLAKPEYDIEDVIRYRFDSDTDSHLISIESWPNVANLFFDLNGNLIETKDYRMHTLALGRRVTDSRLSDVVEEASKDFPIGVPFIRMQQAARKKLAEIGEQ